MTTLTVHLHEAHKKDFVGLRVLERLVEQGGYVALSFGKDNIQAWQSAKNDFYRRIRDLVSSNQIEIVQRGCWNRCSQDPHVRTDPHHEHICPITRRAISLDHQRSLMEEGKDAMEEHMSKTPIGYCPPNGLYEPATIEIAGELNYEYFVKPSMLNSGAYEQDTKQRSVIVVPQRRLKQNIGGNSYTHLDHLPDIRQSLLDELASKLQSLREVKPGKGITQRVNRVKSGVDDVCRTIYVRLCDIRQAMRNRE